MQGNTGDEERERSGKGRCDSDGGGDARTHTLQCSMDGTYSALSPMKPQPWASEPRKDAWLAAVDAMPTNRYAVGERSMRTAQRLRPLVNPVLPNTMDHDSEPAHVHMHTYTCTRITGNSTHNKHTIAKKKQHIEGGLL